MNIGSEAIDGISVGPDAVDAVYVGDELAWQSGPGDIAPNAPTSFTASDGANDSHVICSWVDSTEGIPAPTYTMYRDSTPIQVGMSAGTQYYEDYTGVTGTTYSYYVEANNTEGDAASTPDDGWTETASSAPTAPTIFTASDTIPSSINFAWTLPTDQGSPVCTYEVRDGGNNVVATATAGSTTASLAGLNGNSYRVFSVNSAGEAESNSDQGMSAEGTYNFTVGDNSSWYGYFKAQAVGFISPYYFQGSEITEVGADAASDVMLNMESPITADAVEITVGGVSSIIYPDAGVTDYFRSANESLNTAIRAELNSTTILNIEEKPAVEFQFTIEERDANWVGFFDTGTGSISPDNYLGNVIQEFGSDSGGDVLVNFTDATGVTSITVQVNGVVDVITTSGNTDNFRSSAQALNDAMWAAVGTTVTAYITVDV